MSDIEITHGDVYRWPVVLFLDLLAGLFYPLRFCSLGRWCMNVPDANRVDCGLVDVDSGYFWRVLEETVTGDPPEFFSTSM